MDDYFDNVKLACLHEQKVATLEDWLLSSQSGQFKKY